jgi:hypothetical protein
MLQRWIERGRRGRDDRAIGELQDWLTSVRAIMEICDAALRLKDPRTDIGVALDRVDRELFRFRGHAAGASGSLRRRSPRVRSRLEEASHLTYRLRNDTCAYLLRWQTYQQQRDASSAVALSAQRQMEDARLQASRTARQLTQEIEAVAPELESLIRQWRSIDV